MRFPLAITIEVIPHRLPANLADFVIELMLLPMAIMPATLFLNL